MRKPIITLVSVLSLILFIVLAPALGVEERQSEREKMFQEYLKFPSLVKGGHVQPHWMADGNSFWYAEGAPEATVIYKVDPMANTKEPLFDTPRLRQALASIIGHEPPYKGLPFSKFTFVSGEKAVKFAIEKKEFKCRFDTYEITSILPQSAKEKARFVPRIVHKGMYGGDASVLEKLSPDKRWFLGASDHDLYLRSTYDGRTEPLTDDGIKDHEWMIGMFEWAYAGASWSHDSFKVAVTKMDSRHVLKIPIVHWLKPTEEVEYRNYVKSGKPMPQAEIYIIDILSKKKIKVDTGDPEDKYFNIIGWRPDGSEMLFARSDREFKQMDLMAADPSTGSTRIILTEVTDTFLGEDIPYTFLGDGKRFIWRSERDGWAHLYLYDLDGNLLGRLTSGTYPVIRVIAVDEKSGWVYFTAHPEDRPYDTHLYRIGLKGRGLARLTEEPGQHSIRLSPSKQFFLDTHSSLDRPPVVELKKADGTPLQILSEANIEALEPLKRVPPEEFIVKAADGETDLYGVIYKPYDFDPNKKYPVIDALYGGPQVSVVPHNYFLTDGFVGPLGQAMAQFGYIVVNVDARGTPERGKAFQDVVYRNFGKNEIPDHVAALRQLAAERPYMDMDQVGVYGGSWGGYFTARAMLLAPDVYHVGVATYPVYDLYNHWNYLERWMGLPQNNREGYEYGSSHRLADKLKGKLLMIHGTIDVNAHFSATINMIERFVRAGKPYDLIILPEQDHSLHGQSRKYWLDSMVKYFLEHLPPAN